MTISIKINGVAGPFLNSKLPGIIVREFLKMQSAAMQKQSKAISNVNVLDSVSF